MSPETRQLLDEVIAKVRLVYEPEGAWIWMTAKQDRWGGKCAIEMIVDGEGERVRQAISQLVDGAFA